MKRVLLDTNIFGKVVEKEEAEFILNSTEKARIIIYGSDVVRKELRDTSKTKVINYEKNKRRLRILLLYLYDLIVKHTIQTTKEIHDLSEMYLAAYKKLMGLRIKDASVQRVRGFQK